LWENGIIVDLQDLISAGSGLRIIQGVWINDRGEIAANAVLPNGEIHAVLLIPNDNGTSSDALSSQDVTSTTDSAAGTVIDGGGGLDTRKEQAL
jgi:hypothetical protein